MRDSLLLRSALRSIPLALSLALLGGLAQQSRAQLTLSNDMILDATALLMPRNAAYGRSINGVAFQAESLLTYNGYQYATWYRAGASDEDVYVARRNLAGNTWQLQDTFKNFDNGDGVAPGSIWDAHNVISMGVSGDGRMHFSWDLHNNALRLMNTATGVVDNPGAATWNATTFSSVIERSSLNVGGATLPDVTYPQFITKANGDMLMNYRTGSSGNGNVWMSTYRTSTGLWDAPHEIIRGSATGVTYSDPYGTNSSDRNAYINGMNIDGTGRIHTTWVWRETATGGSNHDISYAYSDDGGDTWRNNAGGIVGTVGNPMKMDAQAANNVSGLIVVPMNRGNTLMNNQGQTVDDVGGVHMVMWHKTDAAPAQTGFTTTPSAYYHYFRDPTTGAWSRNSLPTERAVAARADMAYDADGNVYAVYVSPGPGDGVGVLNYYSEGDLIVASASRAMGYQDWSIVSTDTRDWVGEPHIDQAQLLQNGIVSIIMQENSDANVNKTGTPLHVLEYNKLARNLVWAGDNSGVWSTGAGTDWDSNNNNAGDAAFAAGNRAFFDDGAAQANVTIAAPATQGGMVFRNTAAKNYSFTGSPINGAGALTLEGGGTVTLANGANGYTGNTSVNQGKLALSGSATIAGSPQINVATGATLDVTAAAAGLPLSAQTLTVNGHVDGNVFAANGSTIALNSANPVTGNVAASANSSVLGAGQIVGNLSAQTGSLIRVGANGLPSSQQQSTTIVDNFADADLSQYTQTIVLDSASTPASVSFASPSGTLSANYAVGSATVEQAVFLRNDVNLPVGSTLMVDVAMPATAQSLDFGLAVSSTATPTPSSAGTLDTRTTFEWTAVYARPSQDSVRALRAVTGSGIESTSTVLSAAETTIANLYITRVSATSFTVGYTDTSQVKHEATQPTPFVGSNVGTAIGFYADLRAAGSLGLFDNLRIIGTTTVYSGETLAVTGDVSLGSASTLALDIDSPAVFDQLDVSGNLAAGGTLSVALRSGAAAPTLGSAFDLLDFGTASGGFDSFALPTLANGLAWNVSSLLVDGILQVVNDVDLDDDGFVDGDDFLLVQRNSPSLIAAWQSQFGNRLVTPGGGTLPVPEPAALLLALAACVAGLSVRRTQSAG